MVKFDRVGVGSGSPHLLLTGNEMRRGGGVRSSECPLTSGCSVGAEDEQHLLNVIIVRVPRPRQTTSIACRRPWRTSIVSRCRVSDIFDTSLVACKHAIY